MLPAPRRGTGGGIRVGAVVLWAVVLCSLPALATLRAAPRRWHVGAAAQLLPAAWLAGAGPWRADTRTCAQGVLRAGLRLRDSERLRGGGESDSEEVGATPPKAANDGAAPRAAAYQWSNGRQKRGWAWEQGE